MRIRNFVHKGLKRLYTEDDPKGLPADVVGKIRKMVAFLQDMEDAAELRSILAWKAHQMSGDRKGMEPVRHPQLAPDLYGRRRRERDTGREL